MATFVDHFLESVLLSNSMDGGIANSAAQAAPPILSYGLLSLGVTVSSIGYLSRVLGTSLEYWVLVLSIGY